jgi:hypothetical protein
MAKQIDPKDAEKQLNFTEARYLMTHLRRRPMYQCQPCV